MHVRLLLGLWHLDIRLLLLHRLNLFVKFGTLLLQLSDLRCVVFRGVLYVSLFSLT